MGFESFRVELRGEADFERAREAVRRYPAARPDPDALVTSVSAYFAVEDGLHVIEVEVSDQPVRISCRFTLCHPPSVDGALMALVRELVGRLGMEARVCDDLSPQARWFGAGRLPEFGDIFTERVAARRSEWVRQFGPNHFAVNTPGVFEQVILPRCSPVGTP